MTVRTDFSYRRRTTSTPMQYGSDLLLSFEYKLLCLPKTVEIHHGLQSAAPKQFLAL